MTVTVFLAVIGCAAWNKLRLTPALLRQEAGAGARLRASIRLETAFVTVILITTAILTTVTGPAATALVSYDHEVRIDRTSLPLS